MFDHTGAAGRPLAPPTWLPLAFLHPDVAVVLRHAGLGVQEGHPDAALGAEASVVAAAVLDGLLVELVPEAEDRQTEETNARQPSSSLPSSLRLLVSVSPSCQLAFWVVCSWDFP